MSRRPPEPNAALLASAAKIRQMQITIENYEALVEQIAGLVMVPRAAAGHMEMLEHQRNVAIELHHWLRHHVSFGPLHLMQMLEENISEPDYEVEQP